MRSQSIKRNVVFFAFIFACCSPFFPQNCAAEVVYSFNSAGVKVYEDETHYGLVDEQGNVVLQPIYDQIEYEDYDCWWAKDTEAEYLIGPRGNVLYSDGNMYSSEECFDYTLSKDRILIEDDDGYLIDMDGNILLINTCGGGLMFLGENIVGLEQEDGRRFCVIYDRNGMVLKRIEGQSFWTSDNDTVVIHHSTASEDAQNAGEYTIFTACGEKIGEGGFSKTDGFRKGYANFQIMENGELLSGLMDINGRTLFSCKNVSISNAISEGHVLFQEDGKEGFKDLKGKTVVDPIWDAVGSYENGVAVVMKDRVFHVINEAGDIMFSLPGRNAGLPFRFGNMIFYRHYSDKSVDAFLLTGEQLYTDGWRDIICDRSKPFLIVEKDDCVFFVDRNGQQVFGQVWKNAVQFEEGYGWVQFMDGDWARIDMDGNLTVMPDYAAVENNIYWRELSVRTKSGQDYLISPDGRIMSPAFRTNRIFGL